MVRYRSRKNITFTWLRTAALLCWWLGVSAALTGCAGDKAIDISNIEISDSGNTRTETVKALESQTVEALSEESSLASNSEPEEVIIYVYVCGAVQTPGVVELPEGSRAQAALEAAGGFAEGARIDYVNLAELLTDGQKLYFPEEGEAESLARQEEAEALGLVNINTAGEEQLCTLPGIGASRAQDIIRYREQHGAFQTPEDIMKVSGIKENAYEKLKDKIITE